MRRAAQKCTTVGVPKARISNMLVNRESERVGRGKAHGTKTVQWLLMSLFGFQDSLLLRCAPGRIRNDIIVWAECDLWLELQRSNK
jgi:hypothetical protein